ncbi:MAG: hypothetical protein MUC41_16000 [Syntrophobacteraceae bacterium]|jgi:hypothetical protein|nr:hypothetical protein [Syntrophobacteraceae bacterium]
MPIVELSIWDQPPFDGIKPLDDLTDVKRFCENFAAEALSAMEFIVGPRARHEGNVTAAASLAYQFLYKIQSHHIWHLKIGDDDIGT